MQSRKIWKSAVSVGIGLFIAFIGLQNANIVVGGSTLLELFSIDGYNSAKGVEASMNNVGITVLLALIGVGITGILVIKNVRKYFMGNPAHMDFRNYLPDGRYLCAGSGNWILQSASGL